MTKACGPELVATTDANGNLSILRLQLLQHKVMLSQQFSAALLVIFMFL